MKIICAHTQLTKSGCSECTRLRSCARARAWNAANPERTKQRGDDWREKNRERDLENKRAWHQKNRSRMNALANKYYDENKERVAEQNLKWRLENPEKVKVYHRNRKARVKGSPDRHTPDDILAIRKMQHGKCAYCRVLLKGIPEHVDHIIPLVMGGSNGRQNLQILCKPCNLSKGAVHPVDYAQRIGRLL